MTTHVESSDAWVRARDRYIEDLNEQEQQMYFKASPESLLDDSRTAEKNYGADSTTRRVMEKLQPFVTAIVQYGDAVDTYSSTYPLALGPIWGSVKVLLHIAREFGKYFDKLVEMFARIGDVLPRFRTYERLFPNHDRLVEALSMAYLDIITFCINAKAVFRRGQRSSKTTLKVTFKLLWKPFDQQFGQQLNDFRQHQKNVEKEAGLAHMIESADARALVLADQKQLEKRRREESRLRIFAMLQAVDYEAKHRKLQNLRLAGTGDWLFLHAKYVEWNSFGSSAFLCCRGIPGCGKSVLAYETWYPRPHTYAYLRNRSNLIDHLIASPSTPASDVIYYYCDYADQRTLHLNHILGSLLQELLVNHEIPEHIETQLLRIYAGGTRSPSENALIDIFHVVVALRPELYIVFDGLDECEKPVWKAMLKSLEHLATVGQCNVKIFITCVEEGSVSHHLACQASVQLSPAATNEDIKTFVTLSVRSKIERGDLKVRNPKLEQDIIAELISKANGMFLWVFFQLNDLCESSSDAMIRETLRNLPEGLGETYKRIMVTIFRSPLKARLARKVFAWATVAKRPLHVEELREAVAFGPEDKTWEEDKIPDEGPMLESCRGLIVKDQDDETVHFAHHTVRQYLTGGLSSRVYPIFEVPIWNAESLAGRTCVAYLSFSDFETQLTSTTPTVTLDQKGVLESGGPLWIPSILGIRKSMFNIPYRLLRGTSAQQPLQSDYLKHLRPLPKQRYSPSTDLKDKYRLLCYAIEYWEPHTRLDLKADSVDALADSVFVRRLENLAKQKKLAFDFRPWGPNQHFGPYGCVGCPSPSAGAPIAKDLPHMSMIHYAAKVGNLMLLRSHDSTGTKIGDYIHHERYHQETLLIACRNDEIEIVRYLVEQAVYDISDGRALDAAASAGHAEVLQYLLSLDQYPIKEHGHVPLLLAAKSGHETAVSVLIKAGANFYMYDEQTVQKLIESAAVSGQDCVIRTLNAGGAQQLIAQLDTTALTLAARNGHVAATRSLIDSGLPVDQVNARGQTALYVAAKTGHSTLVELLLEYGADPLFREDFSFPSSSGLYIYTPFHTAAKAGHVHVLESFIKTHAIVDVLLDIAMQDALYSAAAGGREKTIRWLVDRGADVNGTRPGGETPLLHAIHLGNETGVRVLLEVGAIACGRKVTDWREILPETAAIDFAARIGNLTILRMLLESIRKAPQVSVLTKRNSILYALVGRPQASVVFRELLEQALAQYAEGKSIEDMCIEAGFLQPELLSK